MNSTMNTKQTFFVSLAGILLFSSCSQDEIITNEPAAPRKAIAYNVTADRATRAQNFYTSSNVPETFVLSAWYRNGNADESKIYFDSDLIQKDASAGTYSGSRGQRYWPTGANDKLDFFAYAGNDDASLLLLNDADEFAPRLENISMSDDAANHSDLVYATAFDEVQTASGSVSLAFKHAMSQISVAAKNEGTTIQVKISEVAIGGMASEGTFYFATSDSESNRWEVGADKSMLINSSMAAAQTIGTTATTLTDDVFMMIPSTYAEATFADGKYSGAYIRLKCEIFNIAKPEEGFNADSDVKIQDGYVYIPCAFNWAMGTKYKYTITFGKGNAGLNDDGQPTLVALDIATPTVEDWAPEETHDAN